MNIHQRQELQRLFAERLRVAGIMADDPAQRTSENMAKLESLYEQSIPLEKAAFGRTSHDTGRQYAENRLRQMEREDVTIRGMKA